MVKRMDTQKSYFEINIEALENKNPGAADRIRAVIVPDGFSSVSSKKGFSVLKYNNITFHSVYDPVKEACNFIENKLKNIIGSHPERVFILGFGSGYHIRAALKKGLYVTVYEPCPEIVRVSMDYLDLSDIFLNVDILFNDPESLDDVWIHPPALKYHQNKKLIQKHQSQGLTPLIRKKRTRLKILVVSPVYGGSYPTAKHSVNALKKIGHETLFINNASFNELLQSIFNLKIENSEKNILHDLLLHLASEMTVATCSEFKPDIVLSLAQAPLSIKAVERLKGAGITTAFWFVEDYLQMPYWAQYASHYDFYFTIQQGTLFRELEKIGVKNYKYLPQAADTETHHPMNNNGKCLEMYSSDLSFMGAGYYNRQKFFLGLLDYNFKIWGTEWPRHSILWRYVQKNGKRISTEETVKIFNGSKININLHSSVCHEGVEPEGDFLNPRTFEIASCGAFQLVDYRSMLPLHFDIDKEVVCFSTLEEAREKINYYLKNQTQREKIAWNSRNRVISEHSFENRMQEMIRFIEEVKPEIFYKYSPAKPEITDADDFCQKHPETREIICRARKNGNLDLDNIVTAVKTTSSTIDYSGALFMLLKEFHDRYDEGKVLI